MNRVIDYKAYVKFLNEAQNVTELYNDGGCMTDDYPYALAHDDIVLLQYSGANDTHERRLYEGDVIKSGKFWWVIRFVNCAFLACLFDGVQSPLIDTLQKRNTAGCPCEFAGNIHQHPELLK